MIVTEWQVSRNSWIIFFQYNFGGPLVCKKDGQTFLLGMLWGEFYCYTNRKQVFYRRLSSDLSWISTSLEYYIYHWTPNKGYWQMFCLYLLKLGLLSFQKVCRIHLFSWMSEHESHSILRLWLAARTIASFVFDGDCLKQFETV